MSNKGIVKLEYKLTMDCPNCQESIDVGAQDSDLDGELTEAVFNNNWDDVEGLGFFCHYCETDVKVERIEEA